MLTAGCMPVPVRENEPGRNSDLRVLRSNGRSPVNLRWNLAVKDVLWLKEALRFNDLLRWSDVLRFKDALWSKVLLRLKDALRSSDVLREMAAAGPWLLAADGSWLCRMGIDPVKKLLSIDLRVGLLLMGATIASSGALAAPCVSDGCDWVSRLSVPAGIGIAGKIGGCLESSLAPMFPPAARCCTCAKLRLRPYSRRGGVMEAA